MSEPAATREPAAPTGAEASGAPSLPPPFTVVVMVKLQAIAIPEAVGGYSVLIPALPGCVTQGETIEEVQANIVEAAEGWLDCQHDHRKDESLRVARGE
jgi:predicted RNase H-like HicB family nuclease